MNKFEVIWSTESIEYLNKIKNNISKSTLKKIISSPKEIVFGEQYQIDEYREDCIRILIGNYKVIYQFKNETISILKIFNSLHNPIKSKE
jgi:mRNA-degrading endonuclease RelE of RelBE toxin-antitoxin system